MNGKYNDADEKKGKAILLIVFFNIIILIAFFFYKISSKTNTFGRVTNSDTAVDKKENEEDDSVSKYFTQSEPGSLKVNDAFYKDDPFKKVCAPASGDNVPNISSNTVCVR